MKYEFTLKVSGNAGNLFKCFKTEEREDERASLKLKKEGKDLIFNIHAEDIAALRSNLNSTTQLLSVYERLS